VARAKFGLGTPEGVQGKVRDPPHSLYLLLMLGRRALRAHEEDVSWLVGKTLGLRGNVWEISGF
jgi:hypothetical protein